jgi:hypothetical protein
MLRRRIPVINKYGLPSPVKGSRRQPDERAIGQRSRTDHLMEETGSHRLWEPVAWQAETQAGLAHFSQTPAGLCALLHYRNRGVLWARSPRGGAARLRSLLIFARALPGLPCRVVRA